MSQARTSTEEILIHVVRPGVHMRDCHLAEGATLADLFPLSGVSTTEQIVFIDGVPLEEALPLRDRAVVTIVAQPRNAVGEEPWRAPVPTFRDEDIAREYSEAMRARREAEPGEDPAASSSWTLTPWVTCRRRTRSDS